MTAELRIQIEPGVTTPVIPAPRRTGRKSSVNKANLVWSIYIVSSRPANAVQ